VPFTFAFEKGKAGVVQTMDSLNGLLNAFVPVASASSTSNQRASLSKAVAAAAVTAISDAVALAATEIALVTPAQASKLLADGAIETVLGSLSRVATILIEQPTTPTDKTSADSDTSAPISAQKLTESIEQFTVNLITKALDGAPASNSTDATVLKSEDGTTTVAFKTANDLPTVSLNISTVSALVPTQLKHGILDEDIITVQQQVVVMILHEKSKATEALFPPTHVAKQTPLDIAALPPQLSTPVVSISLGGKSFANEDEQQILAGNISIDFAVDSNGAYEDSIRTSDVDANPELLSCVWWDYAKVNRANDASEAFTGGWSDEGCSLVQAMTYAGNVTHVTCSCSHLTHFAVLFSDAQHSAAQSKGLLIVSYIGAMIGTLGIMAAFGAFAMHRDLVHLPEKIVFNLLIAVGVSTLMFIGATVKRAGQSDASCKAISGLLHYFLLSCWSWQLCEGEHLYLIFVEVMGGGHPHEKMKWYMLVGWGLPLLFVVPSMVLFSDDYMFTAESGNEICWIDPSSNAVYLYTIPSMVGLLMNLIVAMYVIRAVGNSTESTRSQAIALVTFGTTLGLIYVLGALLMIHSTFVVELLFALLLGSNGFGIFYFHVYRKEGFQLRLIKSFKALSGNSAPKRGPDLSKGKRSSLQLARARKSLTTVVLLNPAVRKQSAEVNTDNKFVSAILMMDMV
jgi:hypothetical protein